MSAVNGDRCASAVKEVLEKKFHALGPLAIGDRVECLVRNPKLNRGHPYWSPGCQVVGVEGDERKKYYAKFPNGSVQGVHRKQMRLTNAVDLLPIQVDGKGRVKLPTKAELKLVEQHPRQLPDVSAEEYEDDAAPEVRGIDDEFDHGNVEGIRDVHGRIEEAAEGTKDITAQSDQQVQPEVADVPEEQIQPSSISESKPTVISKEYSR